jgi:hypothetical protein
MTKATARVLPDDEKARGEEIVQANYGVVRRMYKASFSGRVDDAYVEVTPS